MQSSAWLWEVTESREASPQCCQHGASPAPALNAAAEPGEDEALAERWGKSLMELGLRGCGGSCCSWQPRGKESRDQKQGSKAGAWERVKKETCGLGGCVSEASGAGGV